MNQSGARDRRAPLYGGASSSLDPESLERENDRQIDALGERVGMLRQLTAGIKDEADNSNRLLDNLGSDMLGARAGLGGAVTRFKRVFEEPHSRKMFYIVVGTVTLLFALYLFLQRKRTA